jgi:hypothetical protein
VACAHGPTSKREKGGSRPSRAAAAPARRHIRYVRFGRRQLHECQTGYAGVGYAYQIHGKAEAPAASADYGKAQQTAAFRAFLAECDHDSERLPREAAGYGRLPKYDPAREDL